MRIKSLRVNESGIAHLGLILLVLAVVAVAGFAAQRVISSSNNDELTVAELADEDFDAADEDVTVEVDTSQDEVKATDSNSALEAGEEDEVEL